MSTALHFSLHYSFALHSCTDVDILSWSISACLYWSKNYWLRDEWVWILSVTQKMPGKKPQDNEFQKSRLFWFRQNLWRLQAQVRLMLVIQYSHGSYCSPADEQAPTPPERGLLHIWQPGGPSEQLCPERVLLPRCVLQVALGEHHGLLLTQGKTVCVWAWGIFTFIPENSTVLKIIACWYYDIVIIKVFVHIATSALDFDLLLVWSLTYGYIFTFLKFKTTHIFSSKI